MTERSTPDSAQADRRTACGTVALEGPDRVVAGSYATWTITYTVGGLGMDDGSTLKIATSMTSDWGPPQFDDPGADNYCSVSTTGEATVTAQFDSDGHTRPVKHAIVVDVSDGSLAEGDRVTIHIGDTAMGSLGIRTQTFPEEGFVFLGLVDPFGTAEYVEIDTLTVDVVSGPTARLEAIAQPRESGVVIAVRAVDEWGNVATDYDETLTVTREDGERLATLDATEGTARTTIETDATSKRPGRWTVEDGTRTATTNPVVEASPIRWGDLHGQSEETVGTSSVESYFSFARERAFLDFVSHVGNDFQITDDFWDRLHAVVAARNEPGAFVTFLGYEWSANTPNGGDHNVYFRDGRGELRRSSRWQVEDAATRHRGLTTIEELYDHYRGRDDVLIIPHQGGRPATLDVVEESLTPFLELTSVWGVFEWFGREAFDRGYRLGVVGGSDDHTGRPGASRPTNHRYFLIDGGLMGVPDAELTRESLWEAFAASRCYATTGARIRLGVDVDGAAMGERVTVHGSVAVDATVAGTARLARIDLLRNGERVDSVDCTAGDDRFEVVWTGARSKDRDKVLDWSGGMMLSDGQFVDVEPFGFQHPEHGLTTEASTHLAWVAKTAGNHQGVRFGVDASGDPTLSIRTGPFGGDISLAGLNEERIDIGPVDTYLICRRVGEATTLDADAAFVDAPEPGTYAYQIRVAQVDGEMAWSSPVTVEVEEPG